MKRLFALALLIPSLALADYGNAKIDEVRAIYDGDSFHATIADWPPIIGDDVMIRINSIDAPEMRAKCDNEKRQGRAAKQWLVERLRRAKTIELRHMERGKYFRIVADVYADGEDVGQEMINRGLAVPYDGGKKTNPWCE